MNDPQTNSCGCCEPPAPPTPEIVENRPALPAIRYRVGTYASFRQAMIEAVARRVELRRWTVRDRDDYGIALLEMWAYLADILTFYQERIANEAFLRTALLRDSVLRLAALLDYRPAPGVAATSYLAFTLDKGKQVKIPVGLRVQSVPGQGEKAQKFETVETLAADAALNCISVFPQPQSVSPLASGSEGVVTSDPTPLLPGVKLVAFNQTNGTVEDKEVSLVTQRYGRSVLQWTPAIQAASSAAPTQMFRTTRKFRLFGHNAPRSFIKTTTDASGKVNGSQQVAEGQAGYPSQLSTSGFDLEARYDDLKIGTRVLITAPGVAQLATVSAVSQSTVTCGPLSDTVTNIAVTLDSSPQIISDRRAVAIYELAGAEVTFWNRRHLSAIAAGSNTVYARLSELPSLDRQRRLILDDKESRPEVVTVTAATPVDADGDEVGDHLAITFTPALTRALDTATAVLYGNVVKATHGETVSGEPLGDGDASATFQSFALKKSPVTFVPRPGAPNGAANTLEVRVDGILWQEARSLYGQPDDGRVYTTGVDDEGEMTVRFGDGVTGARPTSGRRNVTATYRQGLGKVGNVRAGTLMTLLDRPVGLKEVTNPRAAEGGADAETLSQARANAPNTVRTFGRIVSLRDFEDAAREFAGIAKARAASVWNGEEQVVSLVVAGDDGALVTDDTLANLVADLDSRRDPNRQLTVVPYRKALLRVEALVWTQEGTVEEDVLKAAKQALEDFFAFDALDLGQPIHLSDVCRALQDAPGVKAVDVNVLDRANAVPAAVRDHLPIEHDELAVLHSAAIARKGSCR